MGRSAKVRSGILNIRIHPHDAGRYADLMRAFYRVKRAAKLRGDRYGIISLLDNRASSDGLLSGVLMTFTRIDQDAPWFDMESLSDASDERVSQISIPENLFPNSRGFYFAFNVNTHRLYVQTYSKGDTLSIRSVENMFVSLAAANEIVRDFGDVKISVVQSKQSLARVFSMPQITKIRIRIERPNADVFDDDFEENIERHLEESNSRQIEIVYTAERGESIVVGDEIRKVSEPALTNGVVEVEGRTANGREVLSTKSHPRIIQENYDTDLQTEQQAMRALARKQ